MNVRLVPLFRLPKEKTVNVRAPRFVIGRADDCSLRVLSQFVSRHHCELIVDRGQLRVRDLASCNGTFVNCKPIAGENPLKDGDILGVFTAFYRVEIHSPHPDGSYVRRLTNAATSWIRCVRAVRHRNRRRAIPTRLHIQSANARIE
jgi:predicted component of type VI protein secretion system